MSTDLTTRPPSRAARFHPVFGLLAAMWAIELLDAVLPGEWDLFGIRPRSLDGAAGILLAPLLHAGFGHLLANTLPFLVLGCLVALDGGRRFWTVTAFVTIVSGLGVWLLAGSNTVTVGASGLIFGYLGYLVVYGVRTRSLRDIVIAVAVVLFYGGMLVGVMPWAVAAGVSWLGHLMGAIAGALAAWRLPTRSH
ncbi:MAG: rhomboid family intramembrane serine protease [Candidatus Nanopelagicales bacterium]